MNKDQRFLDFITLCLKLYPLLSNIPIKWWTVFSPSFVSWGVSTHDTKKILVCIQLIVFICKQEIICF